jgi:hypothetical protein
MLMSSGGIDLKSKRAAGNHAPSFLIECCIKDFAFC